MYLCNDVFSTSLTCGVGHSSQLERATGLRCRPQQPIRALHWPGQTELLRAATASVKNRHGVVYFEVRRQDAGVANELFELRLAETGALPLSRYTFVPTNVPPEDAEEGHVPMATAAGQRGRKVNAGCCCQWPL